LERWKAPTSVATRHGAMVYVSGLQPFDPATGEVVDVRSSARLSARWNKCYVSNSRFIVSAGLEVQRLLHFGRRVRRRRGRCAVFPVNPPALIFVNVPSWPGRFDIEIDCIADCVKACGLRSAPVGGGV
jgi:2-iminobutanoate/2-iminopropanoate deaminase